MPEKELPIQPDTSSDNPKVETSKENEPTILEPSSDVKENQANTTKNTQKTKLNVVDNLFFLMIISPT